MTKIEQIEEDKVKKEAKKEQKPEKASIDPKNVHVFVPKKINLNYYGEWIFTIGGICYGMMCRKSDDKMLVTYNIDPDWLHEDHFSEIEPLCVPRKVYDLFQQKLSADIMRMDNMMTNLVHNKESVGKMFNYAEDYKTRAADGMEQALPYTEEDALKDRQIEAVKAKKRTKKLQQWKPKRWKKKKKKK